MADGARLLGRRVFVTRPIPTAGIDVLRAAGAEVTVWSGRGDAPRRTDLVSALAAADVVLSLLTETLDGDLIDAAPHLLGIANHAVGHDNVDLAAATRDAIPVSNTPDVLTETTADLAWALLLAAARRVVESDRFMRLGNYRLWGPQLLLGRDISRGGDGRQKTLGIVGFGRIGAAVARRAQGFDMRVVAYHPSDEDRVRSSGLAEPTSLARLLAEADFVSLHVPLNTATRHMIGAAELQSMKASAVLVNTSRGPVVDESALVAALTDGWIAAAGLDVYEREPAMAAGLAELSNTVLLPHIGSASHGTRNAMATIAATNAVAMLRGEPAPQCINPGVYAAPAYQARISRLRRQQSRQST
jgi:glyoxylate reductase